MPTVDEAIFSISNVLVLNSNGEQIPVIPTETIAPIGTSTSMDNNILAAFIDIFPNPATNHIQVNTKNIQLQQITLYDLNSQLIHSSTSNIIDVRELTAGLYLIKVQTEAGVYVAKIIVD